MILIRRVGFSGIIFSICEVFTATNRCLMDRMRAKFLSITGSTFNRERWRYCNVVFKVDVRRQGHEVMNEQVLEMLAEKLRVRPDAVVINRMDVTEWKPLG